MWVSLLGNKTFDQPLRPIASEARGDLNTPLKHHDKGTYLSQGNTMGKFACEQQAT